MTANLQEILTAWQNNLAFREQFKKNPEKALKEAGFEVTAEDLTKIQAMLKLKKSDNSGLEDRINK